MPFLLPAAATAIAAAAPAAAAATAATAATSIASTIATVALNAATSMAISAVMSALQPQVGAAGRVSEWTLDPDGPIPFAAGRIGVSGSAVHRKTFGPDLMYLGIASVLSGAGPIDGYEGFQADDEAVAFDGAGKAITSQYANELWVRQTLGTQPDTALPLPAGLKAGGTTFGFGAAHKLSGMAADLVVMGENSKGTAYPTGEVKRLRILRGLKGWDPRLDSTYPGGAGACRLDNPATWVYLTNPILWGLKWSLGLWSGPVGKGAPQVDCQVGGIGAKLSGIDVPAFVAAANVADANGWTVAAYPTTDDDKAQVLDAFLQAGGAIYAERAGKISCIQRAAPRTSIVTITAADTEGPIQIDTAASRIDRINTIRPRFWSEAHRWQLTALTEVTEPTWRVEDGGTRPRGIDYPYVTNASQAAQLAALQIANSREGIAGVIPLKPYMQRIRPGDAFTINEPGFVLNGVKCLCLNTAYDPATGVVSITFVSETDTKYPYALGQSPIVPEPPVLTPIDHTVSPPTGAEWSLISTVFVDGGVSIPALLLTGAVDNARAQSIVFEYRPVGAPAWAFAGAEDPTIVRKEIATLTAGTDYEVAISYRIGGLISDRLVLGPVTAGALVAGDVAPIIPGNVPGTPALAITTAIAPDGTQTSRMFGSWSVAFEALSYIAEIDDGSVIQQVMLPENAIDDRIVQTGVSYRYRVLSVSRTGAAAAAWSLWSAWVLAGGDSAAPGPVTGASIDGGIGQIAMHWANPADDDLSRVLIFRRTTNVAPVLSGDGPYGWSAGTSFIDTDAVIGTVYYYWAVTQDRTGNLNLPAAVAFGSAVARRTRFFDDIGERPTIMDPGYFDGGGYLKPIGIRKDDLYELQDRWPDEGGANKTETRTAAAIVGQGHFATQDFADWSRVNGANRPSDNAGTTLTWVNIAGLVATGNAITRTAAEAGNWDSGAYTRESFTGGAVMSFTSSTGANGSKMCGLADSANPAASYTDIAFAIYMPSGSLNVEFYENGSYVGSYDLFGSGFDFATGVFSVAYDRRVVRFFANNTLMRTSSLTTANRRFRGQCSIYNQGSGLKNVRIEPYNPVTVIGSDTYLPGGGLVGTPELVTLEGVAGGYAGQTAWGTLTRSIVSISKIDDSGRITDGQALPLNGMSKSSTLNPAYPFSAGADPATQINVASVTATFAGGTTLSIGSATISGLSASTFYSIFRDLVANAYVAVSGSTTPYFTSAQRYLYIGTQATQEVGGGYEPLPPPPPGSGGGYGDIPMYVEP